MTTATDSTLDLFKQAYKSLKAPVPPLEEIEVAAPDPLPEKFVEPVTARPVLLREAVGMTLRSLRKTQGLTLREVSRLSNVSLGYISEVELGRKEASSETLSWLVAALDTTVPKVVRLASDLLDEGK
jgi:hypothetical protein